MHRRSRAALLMTLVALCCSHFLFCCKVAVSQTTESYYPINYSLIGATSYVSGGLGDLQANDGAFMAFQSYPSQVSPRSLYAHQETTTIAGTDYYVSSLDIADMTGSDLSASLSSTGRILLGEFVYPLTAVASIPSSTWTIYYRACFQNITEEVPVNSPSWIPSSSWANPEYAYSSNDMYAYSSNTGLTQQYGNYGLSLPPTANITKVEVGYEAYTAGNEAIRIASSWDGGANWITVYTSPSLGTSDPDMVSWVDLTAVANWTATMLSNGNFRLRVAVVRVGFQNSNVFLDWLPVRVTYSDNPPSACLDANVRIRRSDGAIRETLGIDVANSESISTAVQTLSGTYDWVGYTVVDETDCLEIDYYVDVLSANPEATVCLRIDDAGLVVADQTRVADILFPSEYTAEVELSGYCDSNDWSEIVWIIDSSWTTGDVSVALQLYDYSQGTYPTSGDGYIAFQSSSVPNTEETRTQTITTNMTHFRDYLSNWRMRIRSTKPAASQFDLRLDLSTYRATTIATHDVAVLSVDYAPTSIYPGDIVAINVTAKNEGETPESFNVTVYYDDSQIGKQNVMNLTSNDSVLLVFDWNTTGTMPGLYTLRAVADTIPEEEDTADNIFIYGSVRIKGQPVAFFTHVPESPIVEETVTFNASLSVSEGSSITSYEWDFGDGNIETASLFIITHAYVNVGNYTVVLNVTNSDGLWDVYSKSMCVGSQPVATFFFSPAYPIPYSDVIFNATESHTSAGSIIDYTWSFGDGNTTTTSSSIIRHAYNETGNYNVALTVVDSYGFSDLTWQAVQVQVHSLLIVDVRLSATEVKIGQTVNVTVIVKNEGTIEESFGTEVLHNDTAIGNEHVSNLSPATEKTLIFYWNTSNILQPSKFLIHAKIDILPGETSTTDNEYYGGFVNLLPAEDNWLGSLSWDWTWALLGIPFLILLFVGVGWKKRKNKPKSIGIEFLDEITDGGIPDSFSVMLVGGSDSGKSILFQELAHAFLNEEKPCIYIAYECFPDEIRENMKKLQWDTSTYERQGKLSFIDCFSSSAKVQSKEKSFLNQPFSLVDLGIAISKSTNKAGKGVKVLLDSITPLLTQLDPARIIDFLQDRIARVKGVNGNFVFTLNKESVDPTMMSRLEETADCIIELDTKQAKREIVRRLRIKKMRGRNPSDRWVEFEIRSEKGINFRV